MTGRPSDYTPELAVNICQRIADGESVRAISQNSDMPAQSTIYLWLQQHPEFSEQYARAREAQMEAMAEEILEISDDASHDTKLVGREGEEREAPDTEWIARSKLRVDARKWLMSKLAPKKYGDRVTNEHTGKDGGPIEHKHMTDLELARRIAFILTRADKAKKQ